MREKIIVKNQKFTSRDARYPLTQFITKNGPKVLSLEVVLRSKDKIQLFTTFKYPKLFLNNFLRRKVLF
jgi:hypothetical protein